MRDGGGELGGQSAIERIHVPGFPRAVGPYADVVVAGGFVWVSGVVALDHAGNVIAPENPEAQIERALELLRDALLAAGTAPSRLVLLTNYVIDAGLRSIVHRQRKLVLPEAVPASTMIVVAGLVEPGLVYEVEAVALAGTGRAWQESA